MNVVVGVLGSESLCYHLPELSDLCTDVVGTRIGLMQPGTDEPGLAVTIEGAAANTKDCTGGVRIVASVWGYIRLKYVHAAPPFTLMAFNIAVYSYRHCATV